MAKAAKRRDHSFIVRIWHEEVRDRKWRASVTHVATSELRYFTDYADLCTFLDRWLETSPASKD